MPNASSSYQCVPIPCSPCGTRSRFIRVHCLWAVHKVIITSFVLGLFSLKWVNFSGRTQQGPRSCKQGIQKLFGSPVLPQSWALWFTFLIGLKTDYFHPTISSPEMVKRKFDCRWNSRVIVLFHQKAFLQQADCNFISVDWMSPLMALESADYASVVRDKVPSAGQHTA